MGHAPPLERVPRVLRPRPPDDCQPCRDAAVIRPALTNTIVPYAQLKSRRGPLREKSINTSGYACPYRDCKYWTITDPAMHARVGYGHHGCHDPIQDLYCQACKRKFSVRRHTALYGLKTEPARVAQVWHAVAEGLSPMPQGACSISQKQQSDAGSPEPACTRAAGTIASGVHWTWRMCNWMNGG